MKPEAVMIFAAGFGTRMGALTADRPKPLIPVAGRPLLDHAVVLADDAGLRPVVNAHYRADMIRAHLSGRPDIALSDETDEILETGGGLRRALSFLGAGPVFTLNSDAVWKGPNPLKVLRSAWDPGRMEALLLLIPRPQAIGHTGAGDFIADADGRLRRGPGSVYSGAQILRTDRLAQESAAAFSLNPIWDAMARDGGLYGVPYPGQWCDVGRPEGIALAETMLGQADD